MNRYEEIWNYVNDLINDIEKMEYYRNKISCLYSLIDEFSQEYCNYDEHNNKKNFCNFICEFADKEKYNYLNLIDPITLFYDINNQKSSFSELSSGNIYCSNSSSIDELRNKIENMNIEEKDKIKHKYIELLYKNRSKIIHEGYSEGLIDTNAENDYNMPVYFNISYYWIMIFPYKFLKELFLNCIYNYLKLQEEKGLDPFENNKNRKSHYAFYD